MFDSSAGLSRRRMLRFVGGGFGMLGLAGAMQSGGLPASDGASGEVSATGDLGPHFTPRAKRVIFLFMNGGPSHVDTFDPKPTLAEHEGEHPDGKLERASKGSGFMPSPFRFSPQGESGVVMSELFPRLASCGDDLCVLRSMYADQPNHEPGLLRMNSGKP